MSGQVWAVNSLGGYMYSLNLSEELRMAVQPQVKFRQFCDVKDATQQGKKKGDIFTWDVYQDANTRAPQTLAETSTMPETNYTIVQGTLTMVEGGNSVPYSGKLDDLSKHPVKTIIQKVLKNDATKWFDASAYTQFNATPPAMHRFFAPVLSRSQRARSSSTFSVSSCTRQAMSSQCRMVGLLSQLPLSSTKGCLLSSPQNGTCSRPSFISRRLPTCPWRP